jgi:hypothetical protein
MVYICSCQPSTVCLTSLALLILGLHLWLLCSWEPTTGPYISQMNQFFVSQTHFFFKSVLAYILQARHRYLKLILLFKVAYWNLHILRIIRFPFCHLLCLAGITVEVFLPASTQASSLIVIQIIFLKIFECAHMQFFPAFCYLFSFLNAILLYFSSTSHLLHLHGQFNSFSNFQLCLLFCRLVWFIFSTSLWVLVHW